MLKLLRVLFLILILVLPIVNSRFLYFFGFDLGFPINGNFEFTKVMFFNIYSSVILLLGFIYILKNKIKINLDKRVFYFIVLFYFIVFISSIFSLNPYISIFGDTSKAHNFIMFNNLIGLFFILNFILDKVFIENIKRVIILSGFLVSIIGLKEYFFPSFDYGDLGNRLMSTMGHPNYISIYLLISLILIFEKLFIEKNSLYFLIGLFILLAFILTKSYISITLFFILLFYFLFSKINKDGSKKIYIGLLILLLVSLSYSLFFFFPEKIHSFLSRFYIWETTIRIIFSNIKIFFLGGGLETLSLLFDKFKIAELYIYENFGFTADRPHNILLNLFYSIGIGGLIFGLFIYLFLLKNFKKYKNNILYLALILVFIFLLFNFSSIVTYLFIIIGFSTIFYNSSKYTNISFLFIIIVLIFSLLGSILSIKLFKAELKAYKGNYIEALQMYSYNSKYYYYLGDIENGLKYSKTKTLDYYLAKLEYGNDLFIVCNNFGDAYSFAEVYIYCGNLLREKGFINKAIFFYEKGLEKIPDLWNDESFFYKNFFIKNTISGNRFFSEQYGLRNVFIRLGILNKY